MTFRNTASVAGFAACLSLFLAACQGVPADFRVDPALKTASVATLKSKIADACVITQRSRSSLSTSALRPACGCYATRTLSAMTPGELMFYRENGYFSDVTRPKALGALEACKLES